VTSTFKLGRLTLTEMPFVNGNQENPATESGSQISPYGRLLHVAGQEGYPVSATTGQLSALHDDIQGLVQAQSVIPVTFTDKSDRNGFYVVYSATNALENFSGGEGVKNTWAIDLQRVGTSLEVDFESRMSGPGTVNTTLGLSGTQSVSPPGGHYAFSAAGTYATISRACADGTAQTVYTASAGSPPTSARWGCSLSNYPNGRCRFIDQNGFERSGIQFGPSQGSWTISNGLVQVQPGSGGNTIDVACWSGSAWHNKLWDLSLSGSSLSNWSSANLLRNDYEALTLRLVKDLSERVIIDLTLRRGSRVVEIYIQQDSSSGSFKVVRHNAEAGTAGTGTVTATVNDANGDQYTVGSAHTTTADTTNGGLTSSIGVSTFDCYIGAVVGGTGAPALDKAPELMLEYLGRRGEYVQAVRR
jgi:hypothetical protein